jgi:hypothetical protein
VTNQAANKIKRQESSKQLQINKKLATKQSTTNTKQQNKTMQAKSIKQTIQQSKQTKQINR